jgi:heme exporter protein A
VTLIAVEDLACERAGRLIFEGLRFAAGPGDLIEVRGPNGAGKSSLLRLLAGFSAPAAGQITLPGAVLHIGHATAVKAALSVRDNLAFWASCFGEGDVTAALAAFDLVPLADDPAALLSQGQTRRLALARLALISRPIWLLDEPTVGLDAASFEKLRILMITHLAGGGCIIAATHQELGVSARHVVMMG